MRFTNTNEEKLPTFGTVIIGEYFRFEENFYIKTGLDDADGNYYSVNLETGEEITFPSDVKVTLIDIKEIIYEDV